MKISKTYQIVTPESAEDGDFADHGFEFEGYDYTVDEFVHDLGSGIELCRSYTPGMKLTQDMWFSDTDGEIDYSDGSTTYYSWHIDEATDLEMQKLSILMRGVLR